MSLPPAELWRMYRHRAEAENKIKELKYDFGFDSFNLRSFYGTEAALSFVMFAYNLMSLFRHFILHSEIQRRLSTLRYNTFAIGSYLVRDGNQVILKMALTLKRRQWFIGLWEKSRAFSFPVTFLMRNLGLIHASNAGKYVSKKSLLSIIALNSCLVGSGQL
jgi:hypothetical protein